MSHHAQLAIAKDLLLIMSIAGWVAAFTFIICKVASVR